MAQLTDLQKAQASLAAKQGQKMMIDNNYIIQCDQLEREIAQLTTQVANLTPAPSPAPQA